MLTKELAQWMDTAVQAQRGRDSLQSQCASATNQLNIIQVKSEDLHTQLTRCQHDYETEKRNRYEVAKQLETWQKVCGVCVCGV